MFILEKFNDVWNYSFIALALFAVAIGTILTIKKMKKEERNKRKEMRNKKDN